MSNSSDIAVVFSAETGGFVANVEGMDKALATASERVAAAKNSIIQWGQQSVRAAEKSGASAQQLASIQERVASRLASVTEANAQKIVNSLDRQQQKARAVAEELNRVQTIVKLQGESNIFASFGGGTSEIEEGARAIRNVGEESEYTASRVQIASANIRVLRGDMFQNTRAAEAFLSQFQALQGIFAVGFQVAGVIAIGAALFQMGEKAYHAYQNVVNLKGAIEGLNATQVGVDKHLAQLGDQTEQHVEDILSKTEGRSAGLRQKLAYQSDKGVDLSEYFYNDAVKKLPDDVKGNYESLYKNVAPSDIPDRLRKITTEVKSLNDALAFNKQSNFGEAVTKVGDFGAKDSRDPVAYMQARLTLAKQIQTQLEAASTDRAAGLDALSGDIAEAQKQEAEKRQRQTEEAARKAQEATRKAIEAQKALWQSEDDSIKIAGGQTSALEAWMWQNRIDTLKKGSAGYAEQLRFAQHQLATALAETRKQNAEDAKRDDEQQAKNQLEQFSLQRDNYQTSGRRTPQQLADLAGIQMLQALPANIKEATDRWRQAQDAADKYADEAQKASDKSALAGVQQKAQYDLASLAIAVQTGKISKLDAAQQAANIHAAQYAETMTQLRKALAEAQSIDPAGAQAINAQTAIDKADAERKIQVMQDAANAAAASWSVALRNTNATWVQDAQDSAKQVAQLYSQALNGLNENLSDAVTGQKTNWSGYAQGLSKTLATDSLKHLEAPVLGALGFAKADGSKENPYFVQVVGGAGSAGGGLSGLLHEFGHADGDDDDDDSSSGFGGLLKKAGGWIASIFGGGRAVGGGVNANTSYLVGEHGPELLTLGSTSGYITPNNKLSGSAGGDTYFTVNTQGGVSREELNMTVRSALQDYHQNVMPHGARAAVRDGQQRSPSRK